MTDAAAVRRLAPAAALALPVVVASAWLMLFQLKMPAPSASPEPGWSFASAAAMDRIEIEFAFIRAGANPNDPVPFSDEKLTGGREIQVTPLLIAVANDNTDSVAMLMSSGVRLDAPGNRFAVCLARRLELDDLADKIMEDARPGIAPTTCPAATPADSAPLAAYAE